MRHLVWAVGLTALNGGLAAWNLAVGNEFAAGFIFALVPVSLAIVYLGWRSDRSSDRRMRALERAVVERYRDVGERARVNGRP